MRYASLGISSSAIYPQLVEKFDLGTQRGAWVPGDTTALTVIRDGKRKVVSVELGERPLAAPSRP